MNNRLIMIGTPIEVDNTVRIEDKMEETQEVPEKLKFDMKNLNEAYVIVKRYNGGVYFKRVNYVTDVKSYPNKECLYYSKEEADAKVVHLNTTRSKCKYSVESAGKYFINLYHYHVDTWGDWKVSIRNEPISIKDYEAKKYNSSRYQKTIEECVALAKVDIQNKIDDNIKYAERIKAQLPIDIESLVKRAKQQEQSYLKDAQMQNNIKDRLSNVTSQTFKELETQGDKIARVLYAKSETTTKSNNTLTTQNSP